MKRYIFSQKYPLVINSSCPLEVWHLHWKRSWRGSIIFSQQWLEIQSSLQDPHEGHSSSTERHWRHGSICTYIHRTPEHKSSKRTLENIVPRSIAKNNYPQCDQALGPNLNWTFCSSRNQNHIYYVSAATEIPLFQNKNQETLRCGYTWELMFAHWKTNESKGEKHNLPSKDATPTPSPTDQLFHKANTWIPHQSEK